tara:strand:- start:381 stop:593 length:213 start_codon:yes stop_codon:yes gene_type:complete
MSGVNPFEEHPETPKEELESAKKTLTKERIFVILDEEIRKAETRPSSIWGLTREDIIEAIENVKEKIEEA